jgi:peptide/nickel transport system permease protein
MSEARQQASFISRFLTRLGSSLLVLIGAVTVAFLVTRVIPGDPARAMAGPRADAATLERIRNELHLNEPLYRQLARYLAGLAHGDLGKSYITNQPVREALLQRLPATFMLGLTSAAIWMAIAIPLGVLTAMRPGSAFDYVVLTAATLGVSLPSFWIASFLQYELAYRAGWFPVAGFATWRHLLLPSLTLVIIMSGYYARIIHASMTQTLSSPFIRTAAASGVGTFRLLFVHALRNALIPVLTIFGMDLAGILGGVALIEHVFAVPGIGMLAVQAISTLDGPIILGTVVVGATLVVLANLAVDLLYPLLDPRLR